MLFRENTYLLDGTKQIQRDKAHFICDIRQTDTRIVFRKPPGGTINVTHDDEIVWPKYVQ